MKGIVFKTTGNQYLVDVEGRLITCFIKGTFKLKGIDSTNPLAVGDYVYFDEISSDGTGLIHTIEERKNYMIRKSVKLSKQSQILACNIDLAALVITPAMPRTSMGFVDRFIATAEAYHIKPLLIFNKSDLFGSEKGKETLNSMVEVYRNLQYECIIISVNNNYNLEILKSLLKDQVTLISGHSGVGKSSIIKAIEPSLNLKTNNISVQHHKGMHTTTFAEMFRLGFGGYVIDTPGIGEFGTYDFRKEEISHYFCEMAPLLHLCKFNNCLHEFEKDCEIKREVESGKIHPSRYASYLSILHNEDIFR